MLIGTRLAGREEVDFLRLLGVEYLCKAWSLAKKTIR